MKRSLPAAVNKKWGHQFDKSVLDYRLFTFFPLGNVQVVKVVDNEADLQLDSISSCAHDELPDQNDPDVIDLAYYQ